jgi:hypothetical protein
MANEQEHENRTEKKQEAYSPAYTAFRTLKAFIYGINPSAIPRRIDKSMMHNLSGGAKRKLWSGLIFLRLITPDGDVTDHLKRLVVTKEDVQAWKMHLGQLLNEVYAPILNGLDVTTATAKQLDDAFRAAKVEGSTLMDAVRFYVHARKEAGAPLSPYITARQPRSTNGGNKNGNLPKSRPPKTAAAKSSRDTSEDEVGENENPPKPGMMRLPLYLPGKPIGRIEVPEDLVEADVDMIAAILMAHAKRRTGTKEEAR